MRDALVLWISACLLGLGRGGVKRFLGRVFWPPPLRFPRLLATASSAERSATLLKQSPRVSSLWTQAGGYIVGKQANLLGVSSASFSYFRENGSSVPKQCKASLGCKTRLRNHCAEHHRGKLSSLPFSVILT